MSTKATSFTSAGVQKDPMRKHAASIFESVYRKLRLSPDEARTLNNRGGELQFGISRVIKSLVRPDPRFVLIDAFHLVVPKVYNHATRLRVIRKLSKEKGSVWIIDDNVTDRNFANVSTKLIPGQKILVRVWGINDSATSEECLTHLRGQKTMFVGAQGLSLVLEQKGRRLPKDHWTVSFDERHALLKLRGDWRVPFGVFTSDEKFLLSIGHFKRDGWRRAANCLILSFHSFKSTKK